MAFLRRLLGGRARSEPEAAPTDSAEPEAAPTDPAELEVSEHEHELDLARGEQQRLDDLQQRQLRYAQYAWQPPAQGGERRAEDDDKPAGT
jgi:hypothetical protein